MGYVKITKGSFATTAGEILVPADNVATVKAGTGELVVQYLGGFEIVIGMDGNAVQEDAVELIKALDLADGISGPAIPVTLPTNVDLLGTTVQAWT